MRLRKPPNCLRATFSQIFDSTLSIESGRLFEATSWSPSFKSGIISAIFQESGKVEVANELLIMSVNSVKSVFNLAELEDTLRRKERCQVVVKEAKVLEREALSVTVKSYETTSRESQSPPSVVLLVAVV